MMNCFLAYNLTSTIQILPLKQLKVLCMCVHQEHALRIKDMPVIGNIFHTNLNLGLEEIRSRVSTISHIIDFQQPSYVLTCSVKYTQHMH